MRKLRRFCVSFCRAFLARAVMGLLIVLVLYFPGITIMGNVVWKLRAHRKTIARHPFAAAGSAAGQDASPVDNTLATTTDADENADRTTRETRGKDKTRDRDADRLWRAEVNLWMFVVAKFLFALSWVYFSASNLIRTCRFPYMLCVTFFLMFCDSGCTRIVYRRQLYDTVDEFTTVYIQSDFTRGCCDS